MSRVLALVADVGAVAGVTARVGPLSATSAARVARIHAPQRRRQSAAARQLVALAGSRLLARHVPAATVEELADRPGLRLRDAPEIHVSVAHSGVRVAVAVGDGPVGIDVERCDATRDCLGLARHACSAAEVAWLERTAPEERVVRFYLLWTLREAAFKAGLRPAATGGESCLDPSTGSARFCWCSHEVGGYRVSVVTPEPTPLEWLGVAEHGGTPFAAPAFEMSGPGGGTPA